MPDQPTILVKKSDGTQVRMTPNNFAFIDSQNLHLGISSLGWKLDYKKFRRYLKEKIVFMENLRGKLEYKKSTA
ncbi:hypothetical protein KJ785_01145 [Patescibacteria group bacterium]|nr:hypothetical protein [Patescibacteria group bacterium]